MVYTISMSRVYNTKTVAGYGIKFINEALASDTDECIEYPYYKNSNGYARITVRGKTQLATRYVLQRKYGLPEGKMFALHSCNNRPCINWRHLRWGTHQDNMDDMIASGDSTRGADNPRAKLTNEIVIDIFKSKSTGKEIADKYGVSKSAVSAIRLGKRWGWLTSTL